MVRLSSPVTHLRKVASVVRLRGSLKRKGLTQSPPRAKEDFATDPDVHRDEDGSRRSQRRILYIY